MTTQGERLAALAFRTGCIVFLLLLAGCDMFKRPSIVEPPPPEYASGPTKTGRTSERSFDDLDELQRFCRDHGVSKGTKDRPGSYFQACYVPSLDLVVLPSRKAWPSKSEIRDMREHEMAHARGWRHQTAPPKNSLTASRGAPAPAALTNSLTRR